MQIGLEAFIDISDCDNEKIHDILFLKKVVYQIADMMKTKIVGEIHYQFLPYGITVIAIVADSHIALHTWPEYQHVAIDIFSCKNKIPKSIENYLKKKFDSKNIRIQMLKRTTQKK